MSNNRKNKKNNSSNDNLITNLIDIPFFTSIIGSLEYEYQINEKKLKNIPLTDDEYFFDTYFIKPSTMIRFIGKRI